MVDGVFAARRRVDRYVLFDELGCGGMATVYLGRRAGSEGLSRAVAVKRMHPHLTRDATFVAMLLDEARIASRVRHPHVVSILDVVNVNGDLLLVMEFVNGEPLSSLMRIPRTEPIPLPIVSAIIRDLLEGLHAAHEATDELGHPLGIVHRDVSPQNVLIGLDGRTRVIDFGVAKATGRLVLTQSDSIKGKIAYMAPEQLRRMTTTLQADIYSASIVLWELLVGRRLFNGDDAGIVEQVLLGDIPRPTTRAPHVPPALEDVVMKGVAMDPASRFASSRAMAIALVDAVAPASAFEVSDWVQGVAGGAFQKRLAAVQRVEQAVLPEPSAAERPSSPPDGDLRTGSAGANGSLSVSGTKGRNPKRWAAAVGGAIAALVLVSLVVARVGGGRERAGAAVEPPVEASATAIRVAVVVPAMPTSATASAAEAKPVPSPTTTSVSPSPPHTAAPHPMSGRHPAAPATAASHPASSPRTDTCNPPYRRDASGVKVWIPECMR